MDNNKLLTHGSLFSGIGGFDLAAEWAGFQNIFHCDNNDFCRQALEYHFPNSDSYADITTTDFSRYRNKITVLTGGFPCQPFSLAGKRKGADDDRYLWPRMLEVIGQIRPTWIVGENVIGIASMVLPAENIQVEEQTFEQGKDTLQERYVLDKICCDLEEIGYSVQPIIIPACSVGAPHKRDRVWIIARANEDLSTTDTVGDRCNDGSCDWQGGHVPNNINRNATQGESQRSGWKCGVSSPCETVGSAPDSDCNRCYSGRGVCDMSQEDSTKRISVQCDAERPCQEWTPANPGCERQERRVNQDRPDTAVQLCPTGLCPRSGSSEKQRTDWSQFPTQPPIYPGDDGLSREVAGQPLSHKKWRTEAVKASGNAIVPGVAYEILRHIAQIELNS